MAIVIPRVNVPYTILFFYNTYSSGMRVGRIGDVVDSLVVEIGVERFEECSMGDHQYISFAMLFSNLFQ